MQDTIFALSSGGVPAGVAVIRLSGPSTAQVVRSLAGSLPEPRRAVLRTVADREFGTIDQGLVLWFPGPASFTGEDSAEFQVHGGPAVVAALSRALVGLGARPAEAGEFTRRALSNGRLDLTQVEGLADLLAAETEAQRRLAVAQAGGVLRSRLESWRSRLIRAAALVVAEVDFADEDDVPDTASEGAWTLASDVAAEMRQAITEAPRGERVRTGFEVVLIGAPNAGKSSLINALAAREVAIVHAEAGTTRDLVEVRLDLGGYPVTVVDTAGLREAASSVEREGIRRALDRAGSADLVLHLIAPDTGPAKKGLAAFANVETWCIATKSDLGVVSHADQAISVSSGEGLSKLVDRLTKAAEHGAPTGAAALLTRARHVAALTIAVAALDRAAVPTLPIELRAEELRIATEAVGRVTGAVGVDDMLDVVFREFCVGK